MNKEEPMIMQSHPFVVNNTAAINNSCQCPNCGTQLVLSVAAYGNAAGAFPAAGMNTVVIPTQQLLNMPVHCEDCKSSSYMNSTLGHIPIHNYPCPKYPNATGTVATMPEGTR